MKVITLNFKKIIDLQTSAKDLRSLSNKKKLIFVKIKS